MQFVSKLSPEQWAEARRMRAGGASFDAIATRFEVGVKTVRNRAHKEGWAARPTAEPARRGRPLRASPSTAAIRCRLAERLYRVVECRIRMMELRMIRQLQVQESDPDAAVPSDLGKEERESVAALIDSINRITDMASEPGPAADARRGAASRTVNPELTALSDDIDADGLAIAREKDDFRRDLAEHLGKAAPLASSSQS